VLVLALRARPCWAADLIGTVLELDADLARDVVVGTERELAQRYSLVRLQLVLALNDFALARLCHKDCQHYTRSHAGHCEDHAAAAGSAASARDDQRLAAACAAGVVAGAKSALAHARARTMRRSVGVARSTANQRAASAFQAKGDELQESAVEHAKRSVEQFRTHLEAFAVKHKKQINNDHEFRNAFATMCARGVRKTARALTFVRPQVPRLALIRWRRKKAFGPSCLAWATFTLN